MEMTRESFVIGGRQVAVGVLPLARASKQFYSEWENLESRSLEGNAYLSPHFIRPAVRLDPRKRLVLLVVYGSDRLTDKLIGLGVFIARPPRAKFPLPHLEAYRSEHTFRTGMLIDATDQELALSALGAYLSTPRVPWCGIEFVDRSENSAIDRIAQRKDTQRAVRWCEYYRYDRAMLSPPAAGRVWQAVLADGKFGKELRRKQRRLSEMGCCAWRFVGGADVTPEVVERFLLLEHQGWKSDGGTSLLADVAHADFFRDMVARFASAGRAFFTELLLEDRVIASTANFISGRVAFAFKIGWDREFSSVSPGMLNELEFLRHAGECLPGIDTMDSGAAAGSFIERIWPDRGGMTTGILTGGLAGAAIRPAILITRRLHRRINGLLQRLDVR